MKQSALVVGLCVVSGLAGGLLSRVLDERPVGQVASADVDAFAAALRGVERRLDALHATVADRALVTTPAPQLQPTRRAEGAREETQPPEPPPVPMARAPAVQTASLTDEVFTRDLDSPLLPKAQDEVLEAFFDEHESNTWHRDAELRRRWFFLTERAALARFGTPRTIGVDDGGSVRWSYRLVVGGRSRHLTLHFFNGRLYRMDF